VNCQLEHANITVMDLDRAVEFFTTAFPHFVVRGGGEADRGTWKERWLHLGTDSMYIALVEPSIASRAERRPERETGINHVGFVVDDVNDIMQKMERAGHKHALVDERPARRRLYVTDDDGITWEFVQYLSDDPAVRNDYSL
jgi:catechol 2,3-dioxygenase-like lactoylglutathione lyase family enzyme